jgi:hypothetical protein
MNQIAVIEKRVTPVTQEAGALVIKSAEQKGLAVDKIRIIKALRKEVEDTFNPIIEKAHSAHKEAVSQRKKFTDPLDEAERIIKRKIGDYDQYLEDEARREAEKLAEIARREKEKAIDKANKRLEALMAKSGDLSGQIKTIETELRQPDLSDEEREILSAKLNTLMARLDNTNRQAREKETVIETIASAPAPNVIVDNAEKVAGLSSKAVLIPEVFNPLALCKAIVDERAPVGLIKAWDIVLLKKLVNSGMVIPGVKTTQERTVKVR